ncbi:MAG TPA: biopolymer transporter ExbD [Kofleriaceae bacterium]|nr:biopolymer transporter ExbD [Kofleriaceae bacterium]
MTTAGSREINVTPLIDILLVLLIIFLVMLPVMLPGEPIALPPKADDVVSDSVNVELRLEADLSVALDSEPAFPNHELASRLRPKLPKARAVFVDFVDGIPWSHVISTVDTVRGVAGDVGHGEVMVALRLRGE